MNSYMNMGAGALLGTIFVLMSVSIASEGIFHAPTPEKEGYAIVAAEAPAAGGAEGAAPAAADKPIAELLASADVKAGEAIFKKCTACHSVDKGGANKVGPNLWGVVDRPVASHEGFAYSAGMKDFSKGSSQHWTFENLNHFLTAPKKFVAGTAMGFAGIPKEQDRANLLVYLHNQSDNPVALPTN
ncbi:cytochrome c family protein [Agrobacterium vitis]|uniref:C-type cytochrome n=1 Tax=Agrobacterium vitis TaxID=373 RepID=A0AAE5AW85_AGRVI|nr:cytochrome c family protein [Agrobacterium vitis]MCF1499517.1 cytochrome c family protein [Allorhizobium sp. Av2]MCM2439229.1 cytochrome c family protein [Agrobacterium vitis]MUZ57865.1 c-type cytochrome [Agrobacterium vitis]MVA67735.1 c-type cytochrome [Agrobacterium vitis]MVA87636.1 c-type cytochrome [Agrobacterium vitis]